MSEETYKCSEVQKKCMYSVTMKEGMIICDYIGVEGHSRGCSPEKCDKYKPKTRYREDRMRPKM